MAIINISLLGVEVEINGGVALCQDKRVEEVVNLMLHQLPVKRGAEDFDRYAAIKVADWLGGEVVEKSYYKN